MGVGFGQGAFYIIDANPDFAIMAQRSGNRVKVEWMEQHLLFDLAAEDKAITQLSDGGRIKFIDLISRLILDKAFAHRCESALFVYDVLRYRKDLIAAVGIDFGLKHRKRGGLTFGEI